MEKKQSEIKVYTKGLVRFWPKTDAPIFKNKQEAQAFYISDYNVDSMPYSLLFYEKEGVYRRLYPTTRKACKALLDRLNLPTP